MPCAPHLNDFDNPMIFTDVLILDYINTGIILYAIGIWNIDHNIGAQRFHVNFPSFSFSPQGVECVISLSIFTII